MPRPGGIHHRSGSRHPAGLPGYQARPRTALPVMENVSRKPYRAGRPALARRGVAIALAVTLGLGLAACGQYSPVTPDGSGGGNGGSSNNGGNGGSSDNGNGNNSGGGTETSEADPQYPFSLPPSDPSVYGNDGPAYAALLAGCAAATSYLDAVATGGPTDFGNTTDPNPVMWGLVDPRYAVLYMSALVRVCDGDPALADALAAGALERYGQGGLDRPTDPIDPATGEPYSPPRPPGYGEPECDLYRAIVSARDQVSPDTIPCDADGPFPESGIVFGAGVDGALTLADDPCTFDVDESQIVPEDGLQPALSVCAPLQQAGLLATYTPARSGVDG
ncbi:hypothetical protein [Microbacterium sp. NPDC058389]|uniref:hypothetical protein n=1 Tax=Microbacterium sp. NPDC058389 TaxID=3346475 RepID=UPI003663CE13